MSYAQGGTVAATDYNTLGWTNPSIGGQWGVGTSNHGLGQSTSAISTVSSANTVTATQWTGLIQTINSCLLHEGQSAITPSSVTAGNLITYYSTIATGSAAAYNNSGTTGLARTDGTTNTTSYDSAWSNSLTFTQTVTFASGDSARYFFNAGGQIKLSYARSGGSATTRNTDWTALCAACGTLVYGWNTTTKSGGSGTPTTLLSSSNGGYWNTSSNVHFKQFDVSSGYTADYIQVTVGWSGTASNGGYPVLTFTTLWANAYTNVYQQTVDGTCSASLIVSSPSTTYLTNTWGTPTYGGSTAVT